MASGESKKKDLGEKGERSYPHSLQGMLQLCSDHSEPQPEQSSEERIAAQQTILSNIDSERREFMESVLRGIESHDPVKELVDALQILQSYDVSVDPKKDEKYKDRADEVLENLELALESITDLCHDIDLAINFEKLGGYELFPRFIHCEWSSEIRWRAAQLIATIVQNNPHCQERAIETDLLQKLLNVVDTDASSTVRAKALGAVSCMSRDYKAGHDLFMQHDGCFVLLRAMQCKDLKLQLKAAFMLQELVISQPQCKDTLLDMGIVEQLIRLLHEQHDRSHEYMLKALLSLIQGHSKIQGECKKDEYKLRALLQSRKHLLHGKEEHREELDYCLQLINILSHDTPTTSDR